jgi:hypothetical protein
MRVSRLGRAYHCSQTNTSRCQSMRRSRSGLLVPPLSTRYSVATTTRAYRTVPLTSRLQIWVLHADIMTLEQWIAMFPHLEHKIRSWFGIAEGRGYVSPCACSPLLRPLTGLAAARTVRNAKGRMQGRVPNAHRSFQKRKALPPAGAAVAESTKIDTNATRLCH